MEQLIPVVNRLQEAFSGLGVQLTLDLPQIAVVGGQSVGKSSVLENFVGRDFLPRGKGIITRRPLILQLVQSKYEYAEFAHNKGEKYIDFNRVRKEIEDETNRVTKSRKGISNIPIVLRVYSPNVLNLTLIDLPGMTKIPIDDQPPDIDIQIRNMIMEFISNESCLILAVIAANADLANSDALQISREVDPEGLRTIGVLTKIDLMDEGTDALDILENRLFPLKRGYVGVINRSQRDLDSNKDIQLQIQAERTFFMRHERYRHMVEKLGTVYLQKVLNLQLISHIRKMLPKLKDDLHKQIVWLESELGDLMNFSPDDSTFKSKVLLQMIQTFTLEFEKALEGSRSSEVETSELCGGAKINSLFHEKFPFEIVKQEFDEHELRKEIAIAICNIHGIRIGLFTPDLAFDVIVKTQIARLKGPCLNCVDLVVSELNKIVSACVQKMSRYPCLRDTVERIISDRILILEKKCKEHILLYIDIQLSYMNTNHEDFIGFFNAENQADNSTNRIRNLPGDQIIRKGFMYIHNTGFIKGSKEFWFVLTSDNLSWYKDNTMKEIHYILPTNGLKLKDLESKFMSRRHTFGLFNTNGKNIFKDQKLLELSCALLEEEDSWKASFLRAGIYPEKDIQEKNGSDNIEEEDPQLKRQVEIIRNLVDSYTTIVNKSTKDLVPKIITHILLNSVKTFIGGELLHHIYTQQDQDRLIEESADESQKREQKMKMYVACKEALNVISECSLSVITRYQNIENASVMSSNKKKGYRLSMAPPPVSRPAPPPPPGLKKFNSMKHLIPDIFILSIP